MKKLRYLLLVILLLLTVNVKAANCDTKEFARLKELAKKVEFDYEYKMVNDKAVFSVNAVNLNKELKVLIIEDYYANKYKEFKESSGGSISGFSSGDKVTITMKAFVPNSCSGETVLTKIIKLPYYNIYYDEEKCKGNEDFKYCKLLLTSNITEKEYNRQFEQYLKNKEAEKPQEVVPEKDNTIIYVMIAIVVLVVFIITMLIINIVKRRKRNSL